MAIAKKYQAFRYKTQGSGKNKYIKIINFDNSTVTPIIPTYINDIPVKVIDDYAFHETTIESITMPDTLEEIGEYAFAGCHRLKNISFPDSVKNIGDMVCSACHSLEFVKWSKAAERIPSFAFLNCENLREIINTDSVKTIDNHAFYESGLISFKVPPELISLGSCSFAECRNLQLIKMTHLPTIPQSAFAFSKNIRISCGDIDHIKTWASAKGIPVVENKLNTFLNDIKVSDKSHDKVIWGDE